MMFCLKLQGNQESNLFWNLFLGVQLVLIGRLLAEEVDVTKPLARQVPSETNYAIQGIESQQILLYCIWLDISQVNSIILTLFTFLWCVLLFGCLWYISSHAKQNTWSVHWTHRTMAVAVPHKSQVELVVVSLFISMISLGRWPLVEFGGLLLPLLRGGPISS